MKQNDMAAYLFHQGTNFEAYRYLGQHRVFENDRVKTVFRVWAPAADAVFLIGDFNGWQDTDPMKKNPETGLWEGAIPFVFENAERVKYKYKILRNGNAFYKADPYAVFQGTEYETASYIYELPDYPWTDAAWLAARKQAFRHKKSAYAFPMNIYEVHLGSFMRHRDGSPLSYRELADELAPYVKQMGYTHVELMPVSEHPYDGSWGYQICGYYAPTSRFGEPADFMYFINKLHAYGIGVILDWVPAHFPKDAHGLYEFDGAPLYEYQGKDRMEHRGWGTRFFDVGREEIQSFLISNALFWLSVYHADGLRIDAVASMLYLDYDKLPGEWIPAPDGSNKNYEAIAFFQKLNCEVFRRHGDVLMIAEESTSWPMITKPVYMGGLGFNFKWNMGWMNDITDYMAADPIFRQYKHEALTFPLMYAFDENFVLPISHDEVVHGKKSLIDKMFGEYGDKFKQARLFLTYMMTHPGKKLLFMGCEYGQFREWDFAASLEWFMIDFDAHRLLREFTADLNHFYLRERALWEIDTSWEGFSWVLHSAEKENLLSYLRKDTDGAFLLCVFNFSPKDRTGYPIAVPEPAEYEIVFSSEDPRYGGAMTSLPEPLKAKAIGVKTKAEEDEENADEEQYIITPPLLPFSASILRIRQDNYIKDMSKSGKEKILPRQDRKRKS